MITHRPQSSEPRRSTGISIEVSYSPLRKCAAWGVHLFTALGAVAGLMALVATTAHEWRAALLWMGATILVDSLDGTLARAVKVNGTDSERVISAPAATRSTAWLKS